MILPLAHHAAVTALPVFAPAIVVSLVLAIRALRERRRPDAEDSAAAPRS